MNILLTESTINGAPLSSKWINREVSPIIAACRQCSPLGTIGSVDDKDIFTIGSFDDRDIFTSQLETVTIHFKFNWSFYWDREHKSRSRSSVHPDCLNSTEQSSEQISLLSLTCTVHFCTIHYTLHYTILLLGFMSTLISREI